MVVISTLGRPQNTVWYLAYGSNLASSKFIRDRGIKPLAAVTVSIPGYALAMESAGLPYREPSYATIRPMSQQIGSKRVTALGTAYLVTPEQYISIISSEGGGIAYKEAIVRVTPIDTKTGITLLDWKTPTIENARTLVSVLIRRPEPRPSQRYMSLIVDGASESNYPVQYKKYLNDIVTYQPPSQHRTKVGAYLFLSFWGSVMKLMEKITKASLKWFGDEDGYTPYPIVLLVRLVVMLMWWHHDYIHAPVWGRGDGLDQPVEMNDLFEV